MGFIGVHLPSTPRCPHWCAGHEEGATWQVHRAAITKTCRRVITVCNGTGSPVELSLERFAGVEDGRLVVEEPTVRGMDSGDALSMGTVALLAETLARVSELVNEPEVAI